MKLTSLLRLSFAILILAAASAQAATYSYSMRVSEVSQLPSEWTYNGISISSSSAHFNAGNDNMYIYLDREITSVDVVYKASNESPPRILTISPCDANGTATGYALNFIPVTKETSTNFNYNSSDYPKGIRFELPAGKSGNWNIYSVSINIVDPPPVFSDITPNTKSAQVGTPLSFDLPVSTFDEDNLSISAAPDKTITGTVSIADKTFTYTPAEGDALLSPVTFTVTAVGVGGQVSKSFVVTVAGASAKMPPVVMVPVASTNVLAKRELTFPVTITEPDGDTVTTNLASSSSSALDNAAIANGVFSYTPTEADIDETPITFTVKASDEEGTGEASFIVNVLPAGKVPEIAKINTSTVFLGSVITNELKITATDGDPVTSTNVIPKGAAPAGLCTFENCRHIFTPALEDIGKQFVFEAQATDFDGPASREFSVNVALAKPVLKAMEADDYTETSFTADIGTATPGAESYVLAYTNQSQSATGWTEVQNVEFPYTVSSLSAASYGCRIKAVCGDVESAWSDIVVFPLDALRSAVPAIPLSEKVRKYTQDFNTLSRTDNYWFDAVTLPGWYATTNTSGKTSYPKMETCKSYDGGRLVAYDGGSDSDFMFSATSADGDPANRAFGARAKNAYSQYTYGIVFTNTCSRPITNITVKFTGMQFRKVKAEAATNYFYYAKSSTFFTLTEKPGKNSNFWIEVPELAFGEIVKATGAAVIPPETISRSASIPLLGANALKPGDTFAIKWWLDVNASGPTLGIDDVEITWDCAWQKGLVISIW